MSQRVASGVLPRVEVYSHAEISDVLTSQDLGDVCFVVSIGDPDQALPGGYEQCAEKMRLVIRDTDDHTGATEDDVRVIVETARELAHRDGRVLVHCWAGISRSTATAVIANATWMGPGREQEAVRAVLNQRPIAMPNRRMIAIADRLLQLNGALVAAAATTIPRSD